MQNDMKHRLTRRSVWVRVLYMLALMIAYSIAELVLGVVVLLQFVIVLFTGTANDNLLRLGNNLSAFVYQVFRFLTFNTEQQAFPFADWPDEAIDDDNVWTQPEAAANVAAEPEVALEPEPEPEPKTETAAARAADAGPSSEAADPVADGGEGAPSQPKT